jgi:hypothetical protein
MRRYLVVANKTLGGAHLRQRIAELMAEGPCQFHLVVPASHPSGAWSDGEVVAVAARRLEEALESMRELGIDVSGEVGDSSPVRAVTDALLKESYDEIILSTLPPGPSRWLRQDVIHRIQRTVDVPFTHIIAAPEPSNAAP